MGDIEERLLTEQKEGANERLREENEDVQQM